MGFHEKWISLIMHYITTVSYSVLINDVAYGSIISTRGLRQGARFHLIYFCYVQMAFPPLLMMQSRIRV